MFNVVLHYFSLFFVNKIYSDFYGSKLRNNKRLVKLQHPKKQPFETFQVNISDDIMIIFSSL